MQGLGLCYHADMNAISPHGACPQPAAIRSGLPRFGAGQVTLFSDFDGTYLPAEHKTIARAPNKQALNGLVRYFGQAGQFLAQAQNDFRFRVTTGRNLGEFQSLLNHFRRLDLRMPLPDSVITKNGADEYLKTNNDELFYSSGAPPFAQINNAKRDTLRVQTGWDGPMIRDRLKAVLLEEGFQLRQDVTTQSATDYGADSALHVVHDHYDRTGSPSPWTAVLRQDGDLKFFIGLPKELAQNPGKKPELERLQARLNGIFKDLAMRPPGQFEYGMHYRARDAEYGNHPSFTIVPKIEGHDLTKVYDTQQAVANAAHQNDLVIAAGDGDNDFEMLNPARYLKLPPDLQRDNAQHHWVDQPRECLQMLARHPALQAQFDALPFLGVVVAHSNKNHHEPNPPPLPRRLQQLVDAYSTGSHPKILKVSEGQLFEGVINAMKMHQRQNAQFASGMSPALKQAFSGFETSNLDQPASTSKTAKRDGTLRFYQRVWQNLLAIWQRFKAWITGWLPFRSRVLG